MADVKQELAEFGSESVEVSTVDKNNEGVTGGISEIQKEGSVKLGSLSSLQPEQSETGASQKGLDKGSNGVIVKVEEQMGKVSISRPSSDSPSTLVCQSGTENEGMVAKADNDMKIADAVIGNCSVVSGSVGVMVNKSEEMAEETSVDDASAVNGGDKLKGGAEDGSSSDTESESESSSSSSASSSDDSSEDESSSDEEEEEDERSSNKKAIGEVDMEEGEIQESDPDEMVAWNEDDEDTGVKGPIKSRNEVQDLPPVPAVAATLEPHHQMLPVGVVSSIIGAQVVVDGVEKHTPLYDGSILWITESRSPLGIVDEIFGPVKNPYYIVRYNCDDEVPPGIHPGSLISFVPEFAEHVLNDNSLYKKGYDASGENDEEVSEGEEFSDDEKEAEYRRMLKMKKRGATNDQKPGNKKNDKRKFKNQSQNWKNGQADAADALDQSQRFIPAGAGSLHQGIQPSASFQRHGQSSGPPSFSPFPPMENAPGLAAPSTGVWTNGIPNQNMGFPNTQPTIGMPGLQQMLPIPFQQQINPSFFLPGGQQIYGAGPSFAPWPAFGQNVFSQPPLTMGQLASTPMLLGGQGLMNGPQMGQNNNSQQHAAAPGYVNGSPNFSQSTTQNINQDTQNFNQGTQNTNQGTLNFNKDTQNFNRGTHSGGGRRGNYRGGGCFGGRRSKTQRN